MEVTPPTPVLTYIHDGRAFKRKFIRGSIELFVEWLCRSAALQQKYTSRILISPIQWRYQPPEIGTFGGSGENASQSWFKHLDPFQLYTQAGPRYRTDDEWNSLDGPKWRHTLTSVQIQCTVRWNYARWGQIWTCKKKKKKKKKKKNDCRDAGSLSTCKAYVSTHYFEGLMEITCVAGEIRRTAMSKQRQKRKSKFVNLTASAATF